MNENKLFLVKLRGLREHLRISYVVAKDPTEAYEKVRTFFSGEDIGFRSDRELDSIELIAEQGRYHDARHTLFI
jgi:hypothetical protein